ncbi:sugar nucleotide-binding protein [Candidatus Microgenomates bacterium]|nr:sugar nucleotide-binding protein [Candidatus Microgenomates bacterium]
MKYDDRGKTPRTVIVIGGGGLAGSRFVTLASKKINTIAPDQPEFDILLPEKELFKKLQTLKLDETTVLVNFAAITDVDGVEREKGDKRGVVWQTNAEAPVKLARVCKSFGIIYVQISTDYVFSGRTYPHRESEKPDPEKGWYAQSKAAAEEGISKVGGKNNIVRIQMPFSDNYVFKKDFPRLVVDALHSGEEFRGVIDQYITPVYVNDCVFALLKIITSRDYGIWHVATPTIVTPFQFAHMVVDSVGKHGLKIDPTLIKEVAFEDFRKSRRAPRSQHNAFDIPNGRFVEYFGEKILRPLDEMLDEWAGKLVPSLRV